ncbi:MAG: hypothetical protein Alpg2KO_25820 [Alphaproteobacteria bacterium]
MPDLHTNTLPSPLGDILLIWQGDALGLLDFADNTDRIARLTARHFKSAQLITAPVPQHINTAFSVFFADGNDRQIMDLPTMKLGTEFQRTVWAELRRISKGQPISYADLATRLGKPTAVRAVARANALNPISLAVPCHRVIAKGGGLGGYAGGLERKQWLLDHEAQAAGTLTELPITHRS